MADEKLVNLDNALEYCAGDMSIFKIIAETFVGDDRTEQLNGFLAASDMENYAIAVHGVKSASKSIGADTVSEQARQLEMLAKDGDLEGVKAGHQTFIDLYTRLMEELKAMD